MSLSRFKSAGNQVLIDVQGEQSCLPHCSASVGHRDLHFLVDPSLKVAKRFHVAACFSKVALTDAVYHYPRNRRIAVLTESPIDACYQRIDEVMRRFPIIFTHQRDLLARGEPFLPLMFGTNWLGIRDDEATEAVLNQHPQKTAMVSFIGSLEHPNHGAYRFRREIAEYALQRGDVECFGKGIRPVAGKRDALAPFRFSIAMENAAADHYFSEKLIDCLLLETIPVYYGCAGIGELFDPRGLLCFNSREELGEILDSLTAERYEQMRPYALANKQKAIAERWHDHAGLFARLADAMPTTFLDSASRPLMRSGRLGRYLRKLREQLA